MVLFIPLVLTACGDSSNREVSASQYPYGADGIAASPADDSIEYNQTFEYNQAKQVVGYTIVNNRYDDDHIVNLSTVENYTVDPSITPTNEYPTQLTQGSQNQELHTSDFGAVISYIRSTYNLDAETGALEVTPSDQREEHYSYTDSGRLLERILVESEDGETKTETYAITYNSAGDITRQASTTVYPASIGSSYSSVTTISYDSHGNPISSTTNTEGDWNGDGVIDTSVQHSDSFTRTYVDGLLMRTVVTTNIGESGESIYQIDFTYNDQGRLNTQTTSRDDYLDDDKYDTFITHTYTYDSAGRLLTDSQEYSYDNNDDDAINDLSRRDQVWDYNQDGLLTTYSDETRYYSDPINETLSGHSQRKYDYQYTDSGKLSFRGYEELVDSNLDGDFEKTFPKWNFNYTYNDAGNLTVSTYETISYTGDVSSSETDEWIITYTDGVATTLETINSTNGTETYRSTASLSFDDSGRALQYMTVNEFGTRAAQLTYNDDDTVTFLILDDDTEFGSITVDFSTEGIPSGTDDLTENTVIIRYPNTPESELNDHSSSMVTADANDKSYPLSVKIPKIIEFFLRAEGED